MAKKQKTDAAVSELDSRKAALVSAAKDLNTLNFDPPIRTEGTAEEIIEDIKANAGDVRTKKSKAGDVDVLKDSTWAILKEVAGVKPPVKVEEDSDIGEESVVKKDSNGKQTQKKVKKEKPVAKKEKKTRFDLSKKVILLVKDNPKKPGSASHSRFAKYKSGISLGDTLKIKDGPLPMDISWDIAHKFIKLV